MQRCSTCREYKAPEFFSPRNFICKPCRNQRRREKYDYDRSRDESLRRNRGISSADYEAMLAVQDGRCAGCLIRECDLPPHRGAPGKLSVDHNHDTGAIRGLLCRRCNYGIGQASDNPETLRRLADYIEFYDR